MGIETWVDASGTYGMGAGPVSPINNAPIEAVLTGGGFNPSSLLSPTGFLLNALGFLAGPSGWNYSTDGAYRNYNNVFGTGAGSAPSPEQQATWDMGTDANAAYPVGYVQDAGGFYRNTNDPTDYNYYVLDASGRPVQTTPPFTAVPKPTTTDTTSSSSSSSSSASGGSSGGIDSSILTGDIELMGGDTTLGGSSAVLKGTGYVLPNERMVTAGATPTSVHTNPDGSRVVTYSDGAQVWDPNASNPDFSQWPNNPTGGATVPQPATTTQDWTPIINDWFVRFPNATRDEAKTAGERAGIPSEIIDQVLAERYTNNTTTTPSGGTNAGTGTTGTADTGTNGGTSGGLLNLPTRPEQYIPTGDPRSPQGEDRVGSSVYGGTGTGTVPGTGGSGPGPGTGGDGKTPGLSGLGGLGSPTRTTDSLFAQDLFKFDQEYTLINNLLTYGNRGMFS